MTPHSNSDPASAVFGSASYEGATFSRHFAPSSALKGRFGICQGTQSIPSIGLVERDSVSNSLINHYQSINSKHPYDNFSFEELRLADYEYMRTIENTTSCLPENSPRDPPHLKPSHKNNVPAVGLPPPSTTPFQRKVGVADSENTNKPVETNIRIALLEQELRLCQVQLKEATRINTELTKSQQTEAERVLMLTQELTHCEQRTAKAEIAVEYLSELNVQIWTKAKKLAEPDRRISSLEREVQNANDNTEMRLSLLETEKQNFSHDNEKLRSKLENAMDVILALSSHQGSIPPSKDDGIAGQVSHTTGAKDPIHNLIDLLGDCLSPTKKSLIEEQTTTLLNESDDPDDEKLMPQNEGPKTPSDPFDSDFSTSSYIVRFKGVRDMTKHGRITDIPSPATSPTANSSSSTPDGRSKAHPELAWPADSKTTIEQNPERASAAGEPVAPFTTSGSDQQPLSLAKPSPEEDTPYKECVAPTGGIHLPGKTEIMSERAIYCKNSNSDITSYMYHYGTPTVPLGDFDPEKYIDPVPLKKRWTPPIIPHLGSAKVFPIFESLQFRPSPADTDVYRTLMISGLPPDVTLSELLQKVRGGMIFDAQLLDTLNITGAYSAVITFLDGHSIVAYERYTRKYPIIFRGCTARVSVLTPTWPLSPERRKHILDHKQTRCLEIHNFPNDASKRTLKTMLNEDLMTCPNMNKTWLIFRHFSEGRVLTLHFSSIEHASRAYAVLSRSQKYKGSKPYFVPDPCALPLMYLTKALPVETLADSASDADPEESLGGIPRIFQSTR